MSNRGSVTGGIENGTTADGNDVAAAVEITFVDQR